MRTKLEFMCSENIHYSTVTSIRHCNSTDACKDSILKLGKVKTLDKTIGLEQWNGLLD